VGISSAGVFFIVFLLGYSWLSWQGIKNDQSKELSSIAELGGMRSIRIFPITNTP